MSEINAEQAHVFVHNLLLPTLKNESRTTRAVLAAVPKDRLDYRPDPSTQRPTNCCGTSPAPTTSF